MKSLVLKVVASSSDLPAVLEYNIGFKSTMDNDHTFGVYVGMGIGFYRVAMSKNNHLGDGGFLMALYSGLEYAWNFKRKAGKGHGQTMGIFHEWGMKKEKMSGFGFNVLMDL